MSEATPALTLRGDDLTLVVDIVIAYADTLRQRLMECSKIPDEELDVDQLGAIVQGIGELESIETFLDSHTQVLNAAGYTKGPAEGA